MVSSAVLGASLQLPAFLLLAFLPTSHGACSAYYQISSSYTTNCRLFGWSSCTRYRYRSEKRCCSNWRNFPSCDTLPASSPVMSGLPDADWVDADKPYTLICIVEEAKPAVSVQWIIDGDPQSTDNQIEGLGTEGQGVMKTTGTLSDYYFSKSPASQKVTCRVKDLNGDVIEEKDYKTVDVYYTPSASITIPGDDPVEGNIFVLTCDVDDGRPDPGENDFTWWMDNAELPNEKRNILTLTLNHEEHDGEYQCAASNTAGQGSRSAKHRLQVYYLASVMLSEFSSSPAVEGYASSADCTVDDGRPRDVNSVAWYRDGGSVDEDDGRIKLEESITITAVEKGDAGAYTCDITTDGGTKSSQSRDLLVHYSPRGLPVLTVDKNPVAVDEQVTFTCGADDIDALPPVNTSAFFRGADSLDNVTSATWRNSFSTVTASGEYTCVRANVVAASQSSDAHTLQVLGPAVIEFPSSPQSLQPVYGDPKRALNMTCVASGHERDITWSKDKNVLPDGLLSLEKTIIQYVVSYDQDEALRHEQTWIEPARDCSQVTKHNGVYGCEAKTVIRGNAKTVSQNFTVSVQYGPINTAADYIIVGSGLGQQVTLPCDVCANPSPTQYTWSRGGSDIPGKDSSEFIINDVTEADFGNYTCSVTNDVSTQSFIINLVPYSVPEKPSEFQAVAESSQSINVTWLPQFNGGMEQTFQLDGKKQEEADYTTIQTGIADPNSRFGETILANFTVDEIGAEKLEPQTTYEFRVRGENDHPDKTGQYEFTENATKGRPEVDMSEFSYDRDTTRVSFRWEVTAGEPTTLKLWYREQQQQRDSSAWSVMVADIDPQLEEYENVTGVSLDRAKSYRLQLQGTEGSYDTLPDDGAPDDANVKGDPGGLGAGEIVGIIIALLAIIVLVGGGFMYKQRKQKGKETDRHMLGSSNDISRNGLDDYHDDGVAAGYATVENGTRMGAVPKQQAPARPVDPPATVAGTSGGAGGAGGASGGAGSDYATVDMKAKPPKPPKPQAPPADDSDDDEDPYASAPPIPDHYVPGDFYAMCGPPDKVLYNNVNAPKKEGTYVTCMPDMTPRNVVPSRFKLDTVYDTIDFSKQVKEDTDSD